MKKKRIVNKKLIESVRKLPCMACFEIANEAHHVTTVGAGGDDVAENLLPVCHVHHMEIHKGGWKRAIGKYPAIRSWLEAAGRFDILERAKR